MKRLVFGVSALVFSSMAVFAADQPYEVREALMESNGAAAAVAGGMMKNEIPYNPAVAKAVLMTLNATAQAMGDFYPEGSGGGESEASPKIWEDAAGWKAAVDKFKADAHAAEEAAGKDGPADLAAFQTAAGPVLGNCKSCHEGFRIMKQ